MKIEKSVVVVDLSAKDRYILVRVEDDEEIVSSIALTNLEVQDIEFYDKYRFSLGEKLRLTIESE